MGGVASIPVVPHDPDFGCERCPALAEEDNVCVVLGRRMARMERWSYSPASCPLRSGPLLINITPDPTCLPVQDIAPIGTSGGTSDAEEDEDGK